MVNSELSIYWIKKNQLAGSNCPSSVNDIQQIYSAGIKNIVSTAEIDLVQKLIKEAKIEIQQIKLPIPDFGNPRKEQIIQFAQYAHTIREKNEVLLVHCYAGCGRTGILLVIYLMVFERLTLEDALQEVRNIRPCAVETKWQETYLQNLDVLALVNVIGKF